MLSLLLRQGRTQKYETNMIEQQQQKRRVCENWVGQNTGEQRVDGRRMNDLMGDIGTLEGTPE